MWKSEQANQVSNMDAGQIQSHTNEYRPASTVTACHRYYENKNNSWSRVRWTDNLAINTCTQ